MSHSDGSFKVLKITVGTFLLVLKRPQGQFFGMTKEPSFCHSKGTIEEKILDTQEEKTRLAKDILGAEVVVSTAISKEDLMELLDGEC